MSLAEKLAIVAIIGVSGLIVVGVVYAVVRRFPAEIEAERAEHERDAQRERGAF